MPAIRIGNGAGWWGDNLDAPRRLAEQGTLDFLTLEYLAELTLSILAGQRSRNPDAGFVPDVTTAVESLVPALQAQPRLRIVTNGGGMNPPACCRQVARTLVDCGCPYVRIASVSGDDLLPRLDELLAQGERFVHFDTGESPGGLLPRMASINAYLGADGIVTALDREARIVITGRVADASLTVGPARHAFNWPADDWPRIAAATVAGHLIECGGQVTGGMDCDWNPSVALQDIGYPIAELGDRGEIVITKPDGTGGRVTRNTVAQQLVYEIADPAHYLTPDVDADFSKVTLTEIGRDRVAVAGSSGGPPPVTLKVSCAHPAGFQAVGTLVVCGRDSSARARACGELIRSRLAAIGREPRRLQVDVLGAGDALSGILPRPSDPLEVVLRVAAADESRETLERFAREFSPLAGSGPGGVTGYTGPRPVPYPIFGYWPTRVRRELVSPVVEVRTAGEWLE